MTHEELEAFTALDCDREAFIRSYLSKRGVESVVLAIAGRRHIYVKFPLSQYNPQFRTKTVLSHYDRAQGTPGANDNSAAVAFLMDYATHCLQPGTTAFHNIRLIFTDGEECGGQSGTAEALETAHECRQKAGYRGVKAQGAYDLAAVFRRLGIKSEDVIVFDCVGCGTLPIIASSASLPLVGAAGGGGPRLPPQNGGVSRGGSAFSRALSSLEERMESLLRRAGQHYLRLPLPYSDNAGFIAQGIASVCITFLPESEAEAYLSSLVKVDGLRNFVLNMGSASEADVLRYGSYLPPTWDRFHTMADDVPSLSPESAAVMKHILDALTAMRTPK